MPLLIPWSLFLPVLLLWLAICLGFALVGFFLPAQRHSLNLEQVESSRTVCKILHNKGLISAEEYAFEHSEVAARYDHSTFKGYLFILGPVMTLLEKTRFLDRFLLYLVRAWMDVHHHLIYQKNRPALWQMSLARVCVGLAHYTGRLVAPFFQLQMKRDNNE